MFHFATQINEWKIGEANQTHIKSKLEIDPARQMDSGTYECMVSFLVNLKIITNEIIQG